MKGAAISDLLYEHYTKKTGKENPNRREISYDIEVETGVYVSGAYISNMSLKDLPVTQAKAQVFAKYLGISIDEIEFSKKSLKSRKAPLKRPPLTLLAWPQFNTGENK